MNHKSLINMAILAITLYLLLAGIETPGVVIAGTAGGIIFGTIAANLPSPDQRFTAILVVVFLAIFGGFFGGAFTAEIYHNSSLIMMTIGVVVGLPLGIAYGWNIYRQPVLALVAATNSKETK